MNFYKYFFVLTLGLYVFPISAHEIDLKSKLKQTGNELKFKDTKNGKGKPIHENLIVQSVLSANLPSYTYKDKLRLINDLVVGVRWNDDPLHMFRNHTAVGVLSFVDSCKKKTTKEIDVYWDLLYRSHCGDMQFLHSMASKENEIAGQTYEKIMSWLEFTYKTSTGSMPSDLRFRSVHYRMEEAASSTFKEIMIAPNGDRSMWLADVMFSFDCTRTMIKRKAKCSYLNFNKEKVRNIALGSFLHLLQDSYSESHTKRNEDGRLVMFGAYTLQNKNEHADKDKSETPPFKDELVTSSAKIIELVINDRKSIYKFDKINRVAMDSWPLIKVKYIEPIMLPLNMSTYPSSLGLDK